MATWSRRETTVRRVEFVVPALPPWGAVWAEVMKAGDAALTEMHEAGLLPNGPVDDTLRIRPGDDEVIVSYEDTRTTDTPRGS